MVTIMLPIMKCVVGNCLNKQKYRAAGVSSHKAGFSLEPHPRAILRSPCFRQLVSKDNCEKRERSCKILGEFLQEIFFEHLLISPKERKIVFLENIICPTEIRELCAQTLFRHFEVSSICFLPSHLAVTATLGLATALVVDLGYAESTVVPIYSGVQVVKAIKAQSYGGQAVQNEIRNQLVKCGVDVDVLTETVVEDIMVRACFVTSRERANLGRSKTELCPDMKYPLDGTRIITIPGEVRELVMEFFFLNDGERSGLQFLLIDTVLACPIDMRKTLLENIVVIGGTSMVKGLVSRLNAEISALLHLKEYNSKISISSVKFHKLITMPNCAAWLGGAIYGATDFVNPRSFSKEAFSRQGKVSDWCCLDSKIERILPSNNKYPN